MKSKTKVKQKKKKMRLEKYIVEQENNILSLSDSIAQLKAELKAINKEMRRSSVLKTAQISAKQEIETWLKQGESLLKDHSGSFPVSFLTDVVDHVKEISEKIENNYDEYASSGRFLGNSDLEEEDFLDQQLETEIMELTSETETKLLNEVKEVILPKEDDDTTILNEEQINNLIENLEEYQITGIKKWYELNKSMKNLRSIANKLSEKNITYKFYLNLIQIISQK